MKSEFSDTFQVWMDRATSLWESHPELHTVLIIAAAALLAFLVLGIVKSFIKTWIRVILFIVLAVIVCTGFPWVGATVLALVEYVWTTITQ